MFSFWWTPKPMPGRKSTRAQKGSPSEPYRNVMYDKRVVRGSNYGATSILAELDPFDKAEVRRRNALRKRILTRNQRNVLGTPPPAVGRRHEVIQTEKYLEELLEHPPVRTRDTQTDLFLEKPPTPPPFVASKIGVDVGTTIEEGDLAPIKAEEETSTDHEALLIERFVEACIFDIVEEIEDEVPKTKSPPETLTASDFLQNHVAQILPTVLDKFEPESDTTKREQLVESMCPWLSAQLAEEVAQIVDSHEILSLIIEEIIKQRGKDYAEATQASVEMYKTETIEITEEEEKEKGNDVDEVEDNEAG